MNTYCSSMRLQTMRYSSTTCYILHYIFPDLRLGHCNCLAPLLPRHLGTMAHVGRHDPTKWEKVTLGEEHCAWQPLRWKELDSDTYQGIPEEQSLYVVCSDGKYRPKAKHWRDPRVVERAGPWRQQKPKTAEMFRCGPGASRCNTNFVAGPQSPLHNKPGVLDKRLGLLHELKLRISRRSLGYLHDVNLLGSNMDAPGAPVLENYVAVANRAISGIHLQCNCTLHLQVHCTIMSAVVAQCKCTRITQE